MSTQELVDELGAVLSVKADYINRERELKSLLSANGTGAYEGLFYRATVSVAEGLKTNWKAIAERLNASRQLITAHSSLTTTTRVSVKSRQGDKKAA
jgi:hypothetical protein